MDADKNGHGPEVCVVSWAAAVVCAAVVVAGTYILKKSLEELNTQYGKALNGAFEQSYKCAMENGFCSNEEIRSYDAERVPTIGAMAVEATDTPSAKSFACHSYEKRRGEGVMHRLLLTTPPYSISSTTFPATRTKKNGPRNCRSPLPLRRRDKLFYGTRTFAAWNGVCALCRYSARIETVPVKFASVVAVTPSKTVKFKYVPTKGLAPKPGFSTVM